MERNTAQPLRESGRDEGGENPERLTRAILTGAVLASVRPPPPLLPRRMRQREEPNRQGSKRELFNKWAWVANQTAKCTLRLISSSIKKQRNGLQLSQPLGQLR